MISRTNKYLVTLLLAAGVIWLAPLAATGDQAADKPVETAATESASPSQEVRARINAIRANEFFYQSYGQEDPFKVLVAGEYQQLTAAELVDINSAELVGVMWGQDDRYALVEDGEGFGYILRVGDRIRNGRITSIRKNSLSARVTLYGISNKVVLKLANLEG